MNAVLKRHADVYAVPSPMTSAARHAHLFDSLPHDVGELARIIQHLVVYDVVAPEFYGFAVPKDRQAEIHIRSIDDLLDRILALDDRPLSVPRLVDRRVVGRCNHFVRLLVAILRSRHVPVRARCGFGSYFTPSTFEDHWVCEYWNAGKQRWILVDVQFDEVWRKRLKIAHDVLDVPRDRFLVAAEAWKRCRAGEADASKFGISFANLSGLWYIAGNLVRDVAALGKVETLPWDVWGAQPPAGAKLDRERLAYFDHLSVLTTDPDQWYDELHQRFATDPGLAVPAKVFNAVLQRTETFA